MCDIVFGMKPRHKRKSSDGPIATSIRIERTLLERFQELVAAEGKSMNEVIVDSIQKYTDVQRQPSPQRDQTEVNAKEVAQTLARNLFAVLTKDTSWADNIIRSTRLSWSGGLLHRRMDHNALEKEFLGDKFAAWLARRIESILVDEPVSLFVDAGSTNVYACRHLWDHLSIMSQEKRGTSITIITNNEPVAEGFAWRKQAGHFGTATSIECRLLGGRIEPEYGALVGEWTEDRLTRLKNASPREGRYIALAAGNFVRLSKERPSYPIPLVRGTDQKPIKDLYVSMDEVFLIAPLSKLFLHTTAEINEGMGFALDAEQWDEQPYAEVTVDESKNRIRLFTTVRRTSNRLLRPHSVAVCTRLDLEDRDVDEEPNPTLALNQIRHICYLFEEHVKAAPPKDELLIELPHGRTRNQAFRQRFYYDHHD